MHEMSIVQALINQVGSEIEKTEHRGRIVALELAVGRMSGVHVDALRFAFDVLSRGTLVDGAELRIEQPAAVCQCHACGHRAAIDAFVLECTACGSHEISVQGGHELLLQSIELEE